eukprot:4494469-Lingulodinium_polyedra.AAC.1
MFFAYRRATVIHISGQLGKDIDTRSSNRDQNAPNTSRLDAQLGTTCTNEFARAVSKTDIMDLRMHENKMVYHRDAWGSASRG